MPCVNSFRAAVWACTVCLCLLATSCSREDVSPSTREGADGAVHVAEILSQRDAIAASRPTLEAVDATWNLGDTASRVKGYYSGPALQLIDEEMSMGEFGAARSSYFYSPKGNLFAYTEEKESQTGIRTGNVRTERVKLSLLFDESGSLLQGERTVDGARAALTGLESQGVRLHARELELVLQEKLAAPAR
ncbi:MAG: hypothetical protein KIT83_21840 [Bryobacterales bacterium]|nr:hypothetical protein [Bryobacterales bacterium]